MSEIGSNGVEPPLILVSLVHVVNSGPNDVRGYPLRCGVPLPLGACREIETLSLHESQQTLTCHMVPLAYWHEGSLRWVLVESLLDVPARSKITLDLIGSSSQHSARDRPAPNRNTQLAGHLAANAHYRTDSPIPDLFCGGRELYPFVDMRLEMKGADGVLYAFRRNEGGLVERRTDTRSSFRCDGEFVDTKGQTAVRVSCRLDLHGTPSTAALDIIVHNPRAARHTGGYWDLGDEGSQRFAGLSIVVDRRDGDTLHWRLDDEDRWRIADGRRISVYQSSSGGELRDSPNHVNALGKVPFTQHGFEVCVDGESIVRGNRCSPHVRLDAKGVGPSCTFHLESFWANFPKRIDADGDRLHLQLFPDAYPDLFELQGGEKKTHRLHVALDSKDPGWFNGDIICRVDRESWRAAKAIPHLDEGEADPAMDALIDEGVTGPDNFLVKRERIDEYGWRHFGDVHADHETWRSAPSTLLSSHYNNQYDLLYGFIRQSVLSEHADWHRLARDLARHILDIDLYDTLDDRPEYNGGLFWHTDHYRPALTSTHRTYSIGHRCADGNAVGGGPGGEHCYTTGLKLYHLTTGCERARTAVLDLADWVVRFYDGGGTLLEELYKTLHTGTRTAADVLRGEVVSRHRYPIHRGIGNLVVAQLDAFELDGSRAFVDRAERVVLGAIGPQDNLEARGLGDVEQGWFYTIFLQSLIRYLDVKRTLEAFDAAFFYARDSLLHYADWMVEHEKPYLDDPDALEFANHTWAAQEIRRCAVLLGAYRYAPTDRPDLLERSRFFARYVVSALREEPTRAYTRILAILMQNHGASAEALSNPERHSLPPPEPYIADLHLPHTLGSVASLHARSMLRSLRYLSPRAELRWLRDRLRR